MQVLPHAVPMVLLHAAPVVLPYAILSVLHHTVTLLSKCLGNQAKVYAAGTKEPICSARRLGSQSRASRVPFLKPVLLCPSGSQAASRQAVNGRQGGACGPG